MAKELTINEWMTKERVNEILTLQNKEYIEDFFINDITFSDKEEIKCMTEYDELKSYFENLIDAPEISLSSKFISNGDDGKQKLFKKIATVKLKTNMIDAFIVSWGNWCLSGINALDEAIAECEENYASGLEEMFFAPYFPVVVKRPSSIKRFEMKWLIETLREFRKIACLTGNILTQSTEEEAEKMKQEKKKYMLQAIYEDSD